jgi:hypothetical protein
MHRGNRRQRERRHLRDHPEPHRCGNRLRRPGYRFRRGHCARRPDRQAHRVHRQQRRRIAPDGSVRHSRLDPVAAAASCRDSAVVHRCLASRCGQDSSGYFPHSLRPAVVACCSARPGLAEEHSAGRAPAMARDYRCQTGCCPPGVIAGPASVTGDEAHHPRQIADRGVAQSADGETPLDALRRDGAQLGFRAG